MQTSVKNKWADQIGRDEWTNRVEAIADLALRTKVATIVWWDHVGNGINGKPHGLDKYVKSWNAISKGGTVAPLALYDALVSVGYPKDVAMKRVDEGGRYKPTGDAGKPCDFSVLRGVGAESLLFAVATQAVEDVKYFKEHGVIVDGKVNPNWPSKGSNGVIGYSHKNEVEELIHFFYWGELEKLVKGLGTNLDMDKVLVAVGLDDPEEIAQ